MKTPRRHAPARRGLHLQPWDLRVIHALAEEFIVLTRSQICALEPGRGLRRTNFRLLQLLREGIVSRRFPWSPLSPRVPLYYLGPRAAAALGRADDDRRIRARREQAARVRDAALAHLLLVNSVFLKFVSGHHFYSDYELRSWIPQHAAVWKSISQRGLGVHPDGFGEFRKSSVPFHCFLEVDRGSERGKILCEKLSAYVQYWASGQFTRHFTSDRFRVLFVVSTRGRAQSVLRAAAGAPPGLCWVAEAMDVLHSPLFAPVWRSAGIDGSLSLETPA
jgi:hypothetical protein